MRYTLCRKEMCVPLLLAAVLGSTLLLGTQFQHASAMVNGLPVVNPIPDQAVDELTAITFTVSASDPDGQQLTFSLQNAPYGASINANSGVFTWTPTEEQGSGVYDVNVVVSDGFVISSQTVMIIVNDVGGGGHGGGRPGLLDSSPGIGSSDIGSTDLYAEPNKIPLDGITSLTQESALVNAGKLMSLTVQEPDGDVCAASNLGSDIPAGGVSKEYPTDFSLVSEAGDGICDTGNLGTYQAQSQVSTKNRMVEDSTQFETESIFVLPESPIGLIALIGSSLAVFCAFMMIRGRAIRV